MTDSYQSMFLDDPEFQSLLVGCLESLQRGETIDREALARDFPRYADEIHQFLNDRQLLEQVASDFGDVEPSNVAVSAYEKTIATTFDVNDLAAGDTVRYIGEYEILEEIARGGMGVVFKARQQKLKRIVALKMILAGKLADTSDIERFQREARAAGRLKHPAIVPVHEIGEHDGRHYFTMDFVEGQSLAETIREETLSPKRAAVLVRATAEAVHFAHEQGTVHRDLKPANILIDQNGQPQVTDFGLAKMLESFDEESRAELTASGQILGTPSYMSPEQASGKQELVGPASDIYSLGAILYACLTGRAPFVADSPVDTLLQVMKKEPVSPRELNPSVPKDLETICLKCLTKEPHKRYGTAQELAGDLNRFLEGHPVVARPVGPISRYYRWCQRNPSIAALSVLLFACMAAGTTIASKFAIDSTRHAKQEELQRIQAEAAKRSAEKQRARADESRLEAERQQKAATAAKAQAEWSFSQEVEARMAADRARRDAVEARKKAEASKERAQWQAYVSRLQPMRYALANQEYGHLDRMLADAIPEGASDFRGWEWYFYRNLVDQRTTTIAERVRLNGFLIHPTDRNLLIVLNGENVEIWDWVARSHLSTISAPQLSGQAFVSPDAQWLAYGDQAGRVQIIDLETQKLHLIIDAHTQHPNGNGITGIAWEPSGRPRLAISCRGGDIGIWSAATGEPVRTIVDRGTLRQRTDSLDWHAKSGLASGHRHGHLRVWNPDTADLKWRGQFELKDILRLKWNPSGDKLFADRSIWSSQGERLTVLDIRRERLTRTVTWAGDETVFVGRDHEVVLFDTRSGESTTTLKLHSGLINGIGIASAAQILSSGDNGAIRLSSLNQTVPLGRSASIGDGRILSLAWSPDDRRVAATRKGTNKAFVLEARTFDTLLEVANPGPHQLHGFQWSRDGKKMFGIGYDGVLNIWDATTGERDKLHHTGIWEESDLALNQAGDRIAICGKDHSAVYTFPDLQPKLRLPGAWDGVPAFSPIDERLLLRLGSQAKVFGMQDGALIETVHFESPASKVAFSPDGRYCAIGGPVVYVLDGKTFEKRQQLEDHRGQVNDTAFSPDGKRLATAGSDGTIRVWDTRNFDELVMIEEPDGNPFLRLAWSHDGRALLAGNDRGMLYVFGSRSGRLWPQDESLTRTVDDEVAEEVMLVGEVISAADQSILDDLESKDASRHADAFRTLADMGPDAAFAVPNIVTHLRRPDSYTKILAIRCLGRIGPAAAEAVPALHEIFKSEAALAGPRAEAGQALASMGKAGEVAIPTLIERLKNPGEPVKLYVAKPPNASNQEPTAHLSRTDEKGTYTQVRDIVLMHTLSSLGKFGPAARDAVPAIEEVIADPDTIEGVRVAARQALRVINPEKEP